MTPSPTFKIWIDADACPREIKDVVFKFSKRLNIAVVLVANSHMSIPLDPLFALIQVDKGPDIADFYIAENVDPSDLVITADVPLAGLIVEKGATAINPRGDLYTQDTVSEKLSMRNFMQSLRDSGVQTGGPRPFNSKDKDCFTNALDRILTKKTKNQPLPAAQISSAPTPPQGKT